jgi:hypothetical protein
MDYGQILCSVDHNPTRNQQIAVSARNVNMVFIQPSAEVRAMNMNRWKLATMGSLAQRDLSGGISLPHLESVVTPPEIWDLKHE